MRLARRSATQTEKNFINLSVAFGQGLKIAIITAFMGLMNLALWKSANQVRQKARKLIAPQIKGPARFMVHHNDTWIMPDRIKCLRETMATEAHVDAQIRRIPWSGRNNTLQNEWLKME